MTRPHIPPDEYTYLGQRYRAGYTIEQAGAIGAEARAAWEHIAEQHQRYQNTCDRLARGVLENWPHGGRHNGALRVVLGLIDIARRRGQFRYVTSHRAISGAAGTGWVGGTDTDTSTVRRTLTFLQRQGLIIVSTASGDHTDGQTRIDLNVRKLWELAPWRGTRTPPMTRPGSWDSYTPYDQLLDVHAHRGCVNPQPLHEIWEESGRCLGMTACRIFYLLHDSGPGTPTSIAARLRLDRSGVQRRLHVMAEHGMVSQDDNGLWRALVVDLDHLAETLGIAGRRAQRVTVNRARANTRRTLLASRRRVINFDRHHHTQQSGQRSPTSHIVSA